MNKIDDVCETINNKLALDQIDLCFVNILYLLRILALIVKTRSVVCEG